MQNFQRSSADALSIQFIIVWLLGDVFNILGAVLQGVLPTMVGPSHPCIFVTPRQSTDSLALGQIILAIYYTIADIVLLLQCFYYRGFTWRDDPTPKPKPRQAPTPATNGEPNENTGLLTGARERRGSDWSGLSPAVPHIPTAEPKSAPTALQTFVWNSLIVLMVCAAGVLGWFLGQKATGHKKHSSHEAGEDTLHFNVLGQFFGYLCAVAYIASRLPQLILNWRRKTTDGLSMLFFLFACLGNITYVLSIFAYEPKCHKGTCQPGEAGRIYGRYILVNLSWLLGSLLTLVLDLGVFAQYFAYRTEEEAQGQAQDETFPEDDQRSIDGDRWDQRPLLQRNDSTP